jgi:hypothetical protein
MSLLDTHEEFSELFDGEFTEFPCMQDFLADEGSFDSPDVLSHSPTFSVDQYTEVQEESAQQEDELDTNEEFTISKKRKAEDDTDDRTYKKLRLFESDVLLSFIVDFD